MIPYDKESLKSELSKYKAWFVLCIIALFINIYLNVRNFDHDSKDDGVTFWTLVICLLTVRSYYKIKELHLLNRIMKYDRESTATN
jgi:hypothetical protein